MEYYWAMKKKKILSFVTVWLDVENIMLNEISQSEKKKYHMFHSYMEFNTQTELSRTIETDS